MMGWSWNILQDPQFIGCSCVRGRSSCRRLIFHRCSSLALALWLSLAALVLFQLFQPLAPFFPFSRSCSVQKAQAIQGTVNEFCDFINNVLQFGVGWQ